MTTWFAPGQRVHIVGVGGAGMSAIARILTQRGCVVTGSDAVAAQRLSALAAAGVGVSVGHRADAIAHNAPDVVVASSAVAQSNVEVQAAHAAGIPVLARPEATGLLVQPWRVLAVSGTHGKTTTSSMLTLAMRAADVDCSYLIGSELHATGDNAHEGASPWAVVEADESDGTALLLNPAAVAVTNVDADHLDRWGTVDRMRAAFQRFVDGDGPGRQPEFVVTCADDPGAASLTSSAGQLRRTYGFAPTADAVVEVTSEDEAGCEFRVRGALDMVLRTHVPGRHNVLNATAAALLADHAGAAAGAIASGIGGYAGARRRFELQGQAAGVRVFDDYAHHPTAVAATLQAASTVAAGRVIVLCQPYRWYRTAMFVAEYAQVLAAADWTVLVDVFGPGEEPVPGAGAPDIAARMREAGAKVDYCGSKDEAVALIASAARDGDIVLTLGGEDIRPSGPELVDLLGRGA